MWGPENVWLVATGGGMAFIANVLYMLGGTTGFRIALRRYVASAILAGSAILIALVIHRWAWQYLLMYPTLILGFSLPYGGNTTFEKIARRIGFALGVLLCCVIGTWATGCTFYGVVVMAIAAIVGMTSVAMGVMNPWNSAPAEEYIICQILTLFVPFWAFIR